MPTTHRRDVRPRRSRPADPVLAEPSARTRTSSTRPLRRERTAPLERAAVLATAAAAGLLATRADASVSGWEASDALWRAAFAVVLSLAASRSRRWTWIAAATLVGVVASERWIAVAFLAVVVGSASALDRKPRRWVGALVGGAVGVVGLDVLGSATTVPPFVAVAVAAGLVVASGYANSPARVRTASRRVATAVGVVWLVGAVVLGIDTLLARGAIDAGTAAASDGLAAAAGDPAEGPATRLHESADHFARAAGILDTWYLAPVRALPVLGPQARAMGELSHQGAEVTGAAGEAIEAARIDELRLSGGQVDLARLRTAAPAFARLDTALAEAHDVAAEVASPWLLAPLADRVARFEHHVREVGPAAHLAAVAAEELPGILGGEGPRTYLVLFTTPAESRGAGGFTGSWALLGATDGQVEIVEQGRAADVNETPGRDEREVTAPPDYVARYGRFRPGHWFQDVTFSPDVPSSSQAAAEVFAAAGKGEVDGVVQIDPFGLAALLELTGPVEVEGMDGPLTAEGAVELLLVDQYLQHPDEEREDLLAEAGTATFDALLAADLPGPRRLGSVLGPPVRDGRIALTLLDRPAGEPAASRLVDLLDVGRAFPRPDGADMAGLVTQNGGNNKADVFLHRSIDYQVSLDPGAGRVEAVATIQLRNESPAEGLPPAFLGSNDRGLPPGTNRTWVSWYTPLELREARLDRAPHPVQREEELGWNVVSTYVEVPPGGTARLELVLTGELEATAPYRLLVPHQPLANPDEVTVVVRPVPGWRAQVQGPLVAAPGGVAWSGSSLVAADPPGELVVELVPSR